MSNDKQTYFPYELAEKIRSAKSYLEEQFKKKLKNRLTDLVVTENGDYSNNDPRYDGYARVIVQVETGDTSGSTSFPDAVTFYDYDGSVVCSYSVSEFNSLSSMPDNPVHTGLIAQGWNWSLEEAKVYAAKYGKLNIGQMYITDNGATRIYISTKDDNVPLSISFGLNGAASIDWGDGSKVVEVDGNSEDTLLSLQHVYSKDGQYTISVLPSGTLSFFGATSSNHIKYVEKIELGEHVVLGVNAFTWTTAQTITIPISVTVFSEEAFSMSSLIFAVIPLYCTEIQHRCFSGCHDLEGIILSENTLNLGDSFVSNSPFLSKIILPDGVTIIPNSSFRDCSRLKETIIPESVRLIDRSAFSGCTNLDYLSLENNSLVINENAFYKASLHSTIVLPSNLLNLPNRIFYDSNLHEIHIPDTVTSIGEYTFYNCSRLRSVDLPPHITAIPDSCFEGCTNLMNCQIPSNVTSIGRRAFRFCDSLGTVVIPSSVTEIGQDAFLESNLSKVVISSSVTEIGLRAFQASNLSKIVFECETPPKAYVSTFENCGKYLGICYIYVPNGCLDSYMNARYYPKSNSQYTYVYAEIDAPNMSQGNVYINGAYLDKNGICVLPDGIGDIDQNGILSFSNDVEGE